MTNIEKSFAQAFAHWHIRLPQGVAERGEAGALFRRGWSIRWVFGEDTENGHYLDYYATHRMTNDRHVRLFESGEIKSLPAIMDMVFYPVDADENERKRIMGNFVDENKKAAQGMAGKFPVDHVYSEHESAIPATFEDVFLRFGFGESAETFWLQGKPGSFTAWVEADAEIDSNAISTTYEVFFASGQEERTRYLDYAAHAWDGQPTEHNRVYESGHEMRLPQPTDYAIFPEKRRQLYRALVQKFPDISGMASTEKLEDYEFYARFWGCPESDWQGQKIGFQNEDEGELSMEVTDYIKQVLAKHAPAMLTGNGVAVPMEEEEMNWRLFFAHSQDMMGFRADIFTGGPNEDNNPYNPSYRGLRDRWTGSSKQMIQGLAALWQNPETRQRLVSLTGAQTNPDADKTLKPMMDILRGAEGNEATNVFADALKELSGAKIAYKTRKMVRAYIQNSHLLTKHDSSYLQYLRSVVPDLVLPIVDIVPAEGAWKHAIERDFYNVGPAIANYMICDWLLWLWLQGQIEWFDSYKADSVFLKTLATQGKLPEAAIADFPAYCRSLKIGDFVKGNYWVTDAGYAVPPRVLNEAIWLEEAATSTKKKPVTSPESTTGKTPDPAGEGNPEVDLDRQEWPERFHHLMRDEEEHDTETPDDIAVAENTEKLRLFRDDDAGYMTWRSENPMGFVLNAGRKPKASYLILHHSNCWCVSRKLSSDERWTSAYIKICSNDRESLALWARDEVGGELHPCGICCK